MVAGTTGRYPLERRAGEIERLLLQSACMAHETAYMLDRIGVRRGWHCLDIGCGPGGITAALAERTGLEGRVVGLDADPVFLDHAREHAHAGVEFVADNAFASSFADASFDLVHIRCLASSAGSPEALYREALRLTKPGGVLALQEPDMDRLACFPPDPAFDRLKAALIGAFAAAGTDICLGQKLFSIVLNLRLEDVLFRPFLLGFRADDPMRDYLPLTALSLRRAMLRAGLMTEADLAATIEACRAHLADPKTVTTLYAVVQVWGRKPATV